MRQQPLCSCDAHKLPTTRGHPGSWGVSPTSSWMGSPWESGAVGSQPLPVATGSRAAS